jgi:CBS domain containing-hemolysin-like protein
MTLLIGFFLLSILFSFLCSIWEAVLLSITPSFIKRMENEKPATGKLLARLKSDIDKPLSAILTLNTIAHTVGAIGVGAQAGKLFGENYFSILGFQLTYESVIATLMTLAILFLSEIIPKTIGANNWKRLAGFTAKSINLLLIVLKPFVWLSTLITRTLKKDKVKSVFSKQDFAAIAEVARDSGGIEERDHTVIQNILRFDELVAKDIMTPRTVMVTADENQTIGDFYQTHQELVHSRVPLYADKQDSITGVLLKDDLLEEMIAGNQQESLKTIRREIEVVKDSLSLRKIFIRLQDKRAHMAVVIDEYGSLLGLVTLEDIFETLLGLEIMDETDSISDLQAYARKLWEERSKKASVSKTGNNEV